MLHLEICGGIAYGKTTLAQVAGALGLAVVLEDFRANPFFEAFYEDPLRFAFEAELTFSLQHYHQLKRAKARGRSFCVDFSPYLDLAYSLVTLDGGQARTYQSVYERIRQEIGRPDLLIRLRCPVSIALARIQKRARREEAGIDIAYLQALEDAIEEVCMASSSAQRVLYIDSGALDFADDIIDRDKAISFLRDSLAEVL